MIAAAAIPPNIFAPSDHLFASILAHQSANTTETKNEKISMSTKWLGTYFRPIEMSKASITTSVLSRPATIRNVFPYS